MGIQYELDFSKAMAPDQCVELLQREFAMKDSQGNRTPGRFLKTPGILLRVVPGGTFDERVCFELYGFRPSLNVWMNPVPSGPRYEDGMRAMMQIVNRLLEVTTGDAGFSSEHERVYLLRRDRVLYVRDDFEEYLRTQDLAFINMPYQRKALRP